MCGTNTHPSQREHKPFHLYITRQHPGAQVCEENTRVLRQTDPNIIERILDLTSNLFDGSPIVVIGLFTTPAEIKEFLNKISTWCAYTYSLVDYPLNCKIATTQQELDDAKQKLTQIFFTTTILIEIVQSTHFSQKSIHELAHLIFAYHTLHADCEIEIQRANFNVYYEYPIPLTPTI
jgi:hypothetical protein